MENEKVLKVVWNDLPVYPQEERAELYERINNLTLNAVYHELERRLSNLPKENTKGHRHLSLMSACSSKGESLLRHDWLPRECTIRDIRELVEKRANHSEEAYSELEFLLSCLRRARIEHEIKI